MLLIKNESDGWFIDDWSIIEKEISNFYAAGSKKEMT